MPTRSVRLAVVAAVLLLAGCGLTPSQRFGVVAGVLVVGAIAAQRDEQGATATTRQPQCLPNNPNHACQ